ncbi:MAG: hypothetical protein GY925_15235, partial [Actinomycetia bacterium]|nr:hypothetical protein [Actinomycetes bacterium]
YRARQYDPTLARFLQADTITVDGLNRYTYFENKPMILIDPTGLEGGRPVLAVSARLRLQHRGRLGFGSGGCVGAGC